MTRKSPFLQLHLLLLCSVFMLASCSQQNNAQSNSGEPKSLDAAVEIGEPVAALGKSLMHIFEDSKHTYWFGSSGEGVFRVEGKNIIQYTTKDGLCDNHVGKIQEDQSGNLYFNTLKGIGKFDGKAFSTLRIGSNSADNWKLNPDDLWFTGAQDSGVVYRYDGSVLHRFAFPTTKEGDDHIAKFPRSEFPNANYSPYDVYIIFKDSEGHIWFGTSSLGVCRFDGSSFLWISESELAFDGETGFGIRSIVEENNRFWFSNTRYRYKVAKENDIYTVSKENGIGGLDGNKDGDLVAIMSMEKGLFGDIWMVTYNAGVCRFDGEKITHYPAEVDNKQITLFSIYQDQQEQLWLGTHEEGAYKFNGESFERFVP
jgi:ligand-binding sensor domain-containing protein